MFKNYNIVVCAGGTGLYIKAITEGFDDIPKIDAAIRAEVIAEYNTKGLKHLQEQVELVDPETFAQIDTQNPQRLMRALEIFKATGKKLSSFKSATQKKRNFDVLKVGLNMERANLYKRINDRVDIMLENGLFEEVQALYNFKDLNALQTVGYSELFEYLDREISKETAIDLIKRNSRRYAKRQLTWYRKDESIHWFTPNETQQIIDLVTKNLS